MRQSLPGEEHQFIEQFTPRETDILALLAEGMSDREIADCLVVATSTVKWYNRQIYDKLGVSGREQAVDRATTLGLLGDGGETGPIFLENPYKGLRAFREADAPDFFGRETLVARVLARLAETGEFSRFLAVVGPSGSGKSSVVKAGLVPALRLGKLPGSEDWQIVTIMPGAQPWEELEAALLRIAVNPPETLLTQLREDERGLLRAIKRVLPVDKDQTLILIIDQFEEIFTLVPEPTEARFLLDSLYAAVTDSRAPVRVVITLRADFYDQPLMHLAFCELLRQRTEVVGPLSPEELERAIVGPAERVGAQLETGLVSVLVSEVSEQPGPLPMLQYTLTELFDQRRGRTLTMAAYDRMGGALGALARRANAVFDSLKPQEQAAARQVMLRLVTLGEGTEDIRRRVSQAELLSVGGEASQATLDAFDWSRLLTFDLDPVTREATVELAHEAIIREWGLLRTWLDESRDDVRLQRLLTRSAAEWAAAGRDASYLLHGSRLTQFEGWAQTTDVVLTGDERFYLAASITEEKRRLTRRRRVRNLVLTAVIAVALVMSILALWANSQRQHAETAEHEARRQASIGLASTALRELDGGHQDEAVLLALEALNEYPYTSQAESALAEVVEAYFPYTEIPPYFLSYAWSPDDTRIALGGTEGLGEGTLNDSIQIAYADDMTSTLATFSLGAPGCTPREMVWAPGGGRLVSIYMRGAYSTDPCLAPPTVWEVSSGELLLQFTGHESETKILSVDWSPDGASILTTGEDGTAKIWNAVTGTEILAITGHIAAVTDGAWSPSGDQIATTSLDGSARIWDAMSGDEQLNISGYTGGLTGLDWSPDGSRLVLAFEDGIARILGAETGELLLNLIGHDGALVDVRYSPVGDRIATASNVDGTARIWDAVTGEMRLSLPGLGVELLGVAWSSDGNSFTVNGPRHYTIWDVSDQPLNLSGHTANILDGEWSPDGMLVATSSFDNTARIWDAVTGEELHVLDHGNQVWMLDWSPDSTRIVTASSGGTARIWDVISGELVNEVQLSPSDVILFSARWSPDSTRIINGDMTSHNTVWDANTGETLAILDFDAVRPLLGSTSHCVLFGPSWSPDSRRIATGCSTSGDMPAPGVLIWDAATGELLKSFESVYNGAARVDWSPDGTRITAASSSTASNAGMITVWDAATGELLQTFAGHSAYSYGLSWSPDGSRIASGDLDGVVKVWDPETGSEVLGFRVPGIIINVHWRPDGQYIIVSGEFLPPAIRRVWPSTQTLIDHAYECCVIRDLIPEERERFGLLLREEE